MFANFVIYLLFFCTGSTSLIYQVAWARDLTQMFGSTHETISIVLSSFMCGLAAGSFLFGRLSKRLQHPLFIYGLLELIIGIYAICLPELIAFINAYYVYASNYGLLTSHGIQWFRICFVFILLIFPTACMGGSLPIMIHYFSKTTQSYSRQLSTLYGINTFGAVFGALLCGFFLLPVFGAWKTEVIAALCNISVGIICMVYGRFKTKLIFIQAI